MVIETDQQRMYENPIVMIHVCKQWELFSVANQDKKTLGETT